MKTIQFSIPDSLEFESGELIIYIAAKLYEDGKLTTGQAAKMAGLSKRTFIEILGRYNVSIFGDSVEDMRADFDNA